MKLKSLNTMLYAVLFFATTSFSPCQSQVPQNGLVGWWPFNANANDESGNGNNGSVNGASLTKDRYGNMDRAYNFDGQTNFIRIKNSNNLNSKSVSISGWFNPNALATNDYLGAMGIVGKWWQQPSTCNANYNAYLICLTKPTFQTSTFLGGATSFYAGNYFYDKNPILTNQWYHFVFTHDSNTGGKLYINGELVSSNNSIGVICNSLNDIVIGADVNNGSIYRFFNGKLDDFGIWNRALTATEIQQLYNGQTSLDESPESITVKQPPIPMKINSSISLDEKTGVLGIMLQKITPELIKEKELKTNFGILVNGFAENSPAEQYGVKANDVISFIDSNKCVENEDITNYLLNKTAGETVKLIINRYGSEIEIPVILRSRSVAERMALYKKNAIEKFNKEDFDGCIINCSKILEFEPENFTAIGMIALSNSASSRFKESLEWTNRYINLKLKDEKYINGLPQMYACRGLAKFEIKSYEDGCSDTRIAISLGFKGSQVQKAIKLCEDSELIITLQKSGIDKYDKKDYVGSINDFSKILEIHPENYLVLGLRAISRGLISDNNGAIEDINHYINIKSENNDYLKLLPNLYSVRGIAYSQLNSIDKACEDFNKAISMGLNGNSLNIANEKIKLCNEYELLTNEDRESKSNTISDKPMNNKIRTPTLKITKPIFVDCDDLGDNTDSYYDKKIRTPLFYYGPGYFNNNLRPSVSEMNDEQYWRMCTCSAGDIKYRLVIPSNLPNIPNTMTSFIMVTGILKKAPKYSAVNEIYVTSIQRLK